MDSGCQCGAIGPAHGRHFRLLLHAPGLLHTPQRPMLSCATHHPTWLQRVQRRVQPRRVSHLERADFFTLPASTHLRCRAYGADAVLVCTHVSMINHQQRNPAAIGSQGVKWQIAADPFDSPVLPRTTPLSPPLPCSVQLHGQKAH